MKLVFLTKRYAPHIGGVELHVSNISREFLKNKHKIIVVTEQYDANLPFYEVIEGVEVCRIPHECQSKLQIWVWMLKHWFVFLNASIVHAHDVGWWYLPLLVFFWWKPLYTTFHGYEGHKEPTVKAMLSRKVVEFFSRKTLCVGDWMREWYKEKPTRVTYGAGSYHAHVLPKKHNAVFIGRLSLDTGVLEYIKGVLSLKGKLTLDIFGRGVLQAQVEKMIVRTPYIQFHGETTDVEKELASHRFAFVSRYLGIIEAQQVGRLVFAHTDTHIKTSYLSSFPTTQQMIQFHDAESLVSELEYVVNHPTYEQKMILRAQSWAKQQTWDRIATIYEELWQE